MAGTSSSIYQLDRDLRDLQLHYLELRWGYILEILYCVLWFM